MINDDDIVRWAYLLGPTFQIENTEGRPLTGGWMEVYIHGTRNKYYCASDFDGTLHPFKIQLDSLGANVVLASPVHSYDIYVYNKFGSLVMSRYNVIPATGEGTYIGDIVEIDSPDNTVNVSSDGGTNWHISIKDTVDTLELLQNEVATAVTSINDRLDGIDLTLANKKDKQSELIYGGNDHMTITRIKQDVNGEITEVKYEPISLPPQVPNVEITSPNSSINIQSSTDVQTNTKTFSIDVNNQEPLWHYWTGNNAWTQVSTNSWTQINRPAIGAGSSPHSWNPDIKRGIYDAKAHFTVTFHNQDNTKVIPNQIIQVGFRAKFVGKNDPTAINYVDLGSWTYDPTLYTTEPYQYNFAQESLRQNHDTSKILNVANYWGDTEFNVFFEAALMNTDGSQSVPSIDTVLLAEINYFGYHEIKGSINGNGSGLDKVYHDNTLSGDGTSASPLSVVNQGITYTAGDGIDIDDDIISVKYDNADVELQDAELDFGDTFSVANSFLTTGEDGELVNEVEWQDVTLPTIQAGNGISFTKVGTETTISMDSEVGDVVETVEKLKQDLDTQITTNFDMPNISQIYDFADGSNWITHNGACMLYQAFTIPINHEVRTITDDPDTPTLMGIYAQQSFSGKKIMLALYEYTYPKAGESNGSSTYVGDTGPVDVLQGVNEYPLKNRNPSITELRSDKVYYASLYLPSNAFANGLLLAGAPSYGNQSIPAEPRLSCATENITWDNQELDMSDPTTTLNHYTEYTLPDGTIYYQYDIGPWSGGYNERWSSPRFYLQIRNGEYNTPVVPTTPFNDLGDAKLPNQFDLVSNLPVPTGWTWGQGSNCSYVDVQPLANCSITEYEYIDDMSNAPNYVSQHCVYSSDYSTHLGGTATVTDLGQAISVTQEGTTVIGYRHKVTFSSPISLTAGTTYRFLAECFYDSSSHIFGWTTPTNVVDSCNNGWYVDYQQTINRYPNLIGKYLRLTDSNNNHYVI
jgi:hypothetical protein